MKITKATTGWTVESCSLRLRIAEARNSWGFDIESKTPDGEFKLVAGSARDAACLSSSSSVVPAVLDSGNKQSVFNIASARAEKNGSTAVVTLEGSCGKHSFAQKLTATDNETTISVETQFAITRPVKIASLGIPIVFLPGGRLLRNYDKPDFAWIPTLRRKPEHVVADQIFRSPAAIVQKDNFALSLIPDLDSLSVNRPVPTCLDFQMEFGNLDAPVLWYGFKPYKLDGHVYFRRAPELAKVFRDETLTIAFDILVSAGEQPRSAHRSAARHLWKRYGLPLVKNVEPQAATYNAYSKHACNFAFNTGGIYREFDIAGTTVAGTIASSFASRKPPEILGTSALKASLSANKLLPVLHEITNNLVMTNPAINDAAEILLHLYPAPVPPLIMNQSWFCNLRTAYGFYSFGKRWNDRSVCSRANKMKELALASPVENGLWSSVCFFPDGKPLWYEGTRAFECVHHYHIPDNSWTGVWMLNWYCDIEQDNRLLEKTSGLGDFLLAAQQANGSIPSWVKFRSGKTKVANTLRESAQTAAPAMFLAKLAAITQDTKYLRSAEKAAGFIINNVMPDNKWWDYETFFSCSKKDRRMTDSGSGIHCMNNLCVFWTAELMRLLYEQTGKDEYLEAGLNALDLLCLWQQVWNAPYISVNTFGGFGVMNTDAEWNDARQSMFAETLAGYYELTGTPEYFERAVAALRSSFTLMLCPENKEVAPGNLGRLRKKDYGATYENYAHLGFDRRVPGYVMFDWGSGGALAASARISLKYGDIYIDAKTNAAFGIDLCSVQSVDITPASIGLKITPQETASRENLIIVAAGVSGPAKTLSINGRNFGKHSSANFAKGVTLNKS